MITIERIDQVASDNAYTVHHTFEISLNGVGIGALLISHIDYAKFEQELTSGRWVMRQRSYLWPLRRHLLDERQIRAKLSPLLAGFRGVSGVLTMIDEIAIDEGSPLVRQQVIDLMKALRETLASKSDFIACLNWQGEAKQLNISPLDMLTAMAPYRGTAISDAFAVGRIPPLATSIEMPFSDIKPYSLAVD